MKNTLVLKRVCYGKKDTPKELREYKIACIDSLVGNIEDWKDFAKKQGYNNLVFGEDDGTIMEVEVK